MSKQVILSIIFAAGMAVLIMEVMPSQKKAQRIYRSMRASGRRTKKDILDIYAE